MAQNQRPAAKVRAGAISCALWQNEIVVGGRKVAALKASIERRYKDASGEWRSANSFGRNEIPLAMYCLQKAFEHIIEHETAAGEESVIEDELSA